jgi:hypothetical protein
MQRARALGFTPGSPTMRLANGRVMFFPLSFIQVTSSDFYLIIILKGIIIILAESG